MSSQKNTGPDSGTRKDGQDAGRAYQSEAEMFGFDLDDDEPEATAAPAGTPAPAAKDKATKGTATTDKTAKDGDAKATADTAASTAKAAEPGVSKSASSKTSSGSATSSFTNSWSTAGASASEKSEKSEKAEETGKKADPTTDKDSADEKSDATSRTGDAVKSDEDAKDSEDAKDTKARAGRTWPLWMRLAAVVLAVVGVAAAAWQGVGYYQDRQAQQRSELRDRLVDTTTQVLVNAMSLEPDTFDQSMDYVRENSVGTFQSEYDQYDEQMRKYLEDNKIRTEARIPNVAMSEIDTDHGLATAVVVYTVTAFKDDKLQAAARQALRISLERQGDGNDAQWKISEKAELGPMVPIGPTSQSVQELDQLTGGAAGGGGATGGGDASGASAAPTSGNRKPQSSAQATTGASTSPKPTTSTQTGGR